MKTQVWYPKRPAHFPDLYRWDLPTVTTSFLDFACSWMAVSASFNGTKIPPSWTVVTSVVKCPKFADRTTDRKFWTQSRDRLTTEGGNSGYPKISDVGFFWISECIRTKTVLLWLTIINHHCSENSLNNDMEVINCYWYIYWELTWQRREKGRHLDIERKWRWPWRKKQ